MKILVTGGAGYIGSYVVRELVKKQHEVVAVDDLSNTEAPKLFPVVRRRCDDVRDEVDVLIHLAGSICVADAPWRLWYNNIGCAIPMLMNIHAKKVIVASSAAVYGDATDFREEGRAKPTEVYGRTKLALEELALDLCPNVTALRLFNVAGGKERHLHETHLLPLALRATEKKPLTLHGDALTMVRDYVHVEDVADAFVRAIGWPPGIVNIGSGEGTSTQELLRHVEDVTGTGTSRKYAFGPPRSGDVSRLIANIDIARALGWEPKYDVKTIVASAWEHEKPE